MTFEAARAKKLSQTLHYNILQLTRAMRAIGAVVCVTQSPTVATPRLEWWILRWWKEKSKVARFRMWTIDIYPGPMSGAVGITCGTHFPAEKCPVPASEPYVVSQPLSEGADSAG